MEGRIRPDETTKKEMPVDKEGCCGKIILNKANRHRGCGNRHKPSLQLPRKSLILTYAKHWFISCMLSILIPTAFRTFQVPTEEAGEYGMRTRSLGPPPLPFDSIDPVFVGKEAFFCVCVCVCCWGSGSARDSPGDVETR